MSHWQRIGCACVLGLWLWLPAMAVWSAEGVVRVGPDTTQVELEAATRYLRDPTRLRRIDEVAAADGQFLPLPVTAAGQSANFGYIKDAIWLRFEVLREEASAGVAVASGDPWVVEIAYPTIDHATLYWMDGSGEWQSAETGDHLPQSLRALRHFNLLLPLALPPGEPRVFYLRLQSEGNLTAPLKLWSARALADADRGVLTWHAAYFGALVALLIYNLILYLTVREKAYLTYVMMVLGMGLAQAAMTGFGGLWLWPEAGLLADRILPLGFALCGLGGALFTRLFLELQRGPQARDRLVIATALMFGGLLVFGLWLPYESLAILISATGLAFSMLAVVLGMLCLAEGQRAARFFLISWLILLLGVGVMALRNFALLPTNWLTSHLMQIGSLLEMLLLAIALADRINSLRAEMDRAHLASAEANQRLVSTLRDWGAALKQEVAERTKALRTANERLAHSEERERHLREEQGHFLGMISHEIRTPLAIIQAASQSLRELEGGSPLERLKRYDRMERAMQRVNVLIDLALAQDRTNVSEWAMDCTEIDLEALSHELCGLISASDEFRVKLTVQRPLPCVLGDVKMLRVVGINLLENALKYSDPLSPVNVMLGFDSQDGVEGIRWTFQDMGPGIPSGLEEKIFEKYFRAMGGYGKPGLGVGLFLARYICERHGGCLRLAGKQPDQGTSFEVWLPLNAVQAQC